METCTADAAGTQRGQRDADEGVRVDALVLRQFEAWSIPELEEYIAIADRETGGYPAWCHQQACKVLARRKGVFPADFIRYIMIEDGCADFADLSDAEVASAVKGLGVDEADEPDEGEIEDEEPERWDGQD